jgi:hypothetical protein
VALLASMLATYAATTASAIHHHARHLLRRENVTIHWAGASIGEVDSLPTAEACLLHALPNCKARSLSELSCTRQAESRAVQARNMLRQVAGTARLV